MDLWVMSQALFDWTGYTWLRAVDAAAAHVCSFYFASLCAELQTFTYGREECREVWINSVFVCVTCSFVCLQSS